APVLSGSRPSPHGEETAGSRSRALLALDDDVARAVSALDPQEQRLVRGGLSHLRAQLVRRADRPPVDLHDDVAGLDRPGGRPVGRDAGHAGPAALRIVDLEPERAGAGRLRTRAPLLCL